MHQKKTPHKPRNGALCALEVIRLLSFDSMATGTDEGSTKSTTSPITPQTSRTIISSDNDASTSTDTEERPTSNSKLLVHLPSPMSILDRSNSYGNQTSPSYLSSDTSSENEESRFSIENDYPNFISFSSAHSFQPQSSPHASSTTKRLSVTTLDEWNRRCDEEGGVFLREHFTTSMLNLNSSQEKSWIPLAEQRDRLNSQTSSSLSNSYHGYNKDDWGDDDISLTYSHD